MVQDSGEPSGLLSLGTNETIAATHLPRLLVKYNQRFPKVELSLRVALTRELIVDVLNYKLDGAFVIGPIYDNLLQTIPIFQEELVVITKSERLSEWSTMNILTRPHCPYKIKLDQWLETNGIHPDNVLELGTLESIIHCVQAGLGIAIIPKPLAIQQIAEGKIVMHPLHGTNQTVDLFFIHRKDVYLDQAYRAFLHLLQEE